MLHFTSKYSSHLDRITFSDHYNYVNGSNLIAEPMKSCNVCWADGKAQDAHIHLNMLNISFIHVNIIIIMK